MQKSRGKKGEPWTGVRNFTARTNLKTMKNGDLAFFYHTGDEKQIVGIVETIREAYTDPTDEKGVFKTLDVKAVKPVLKPVTLAAVTTTAMINPSASTARPRLRPGTFLPESLPVWPAGTWFAARIDWVSSTTADGSSRRPAFSRAWQRSRS